MKKKNNKKQKLINTNKIHQNTLEFTHQRVKLALRKLIKLITLIKFTYTEKSKKKERKGTKILEK